MNKISYAVLIGMLSISGISFAQSESFEDVQESSNYEIIRLQNDIAGLSKKRSAVENNIKTIEENYGIAANAELNKSEASPDEKNIVSESKNMPNVEDGAKQKLKEEVVPEKVTLPKPPAKRYNPQKKFNNDGNSRGRRPFIRSEVSGGEKIYYAGIRGSETVGFGDEQTYSGFTDDNVYVFPDALANNCELNAADAAKDGKMEKCLDSILSDLSQPEQSTKDVTKAMFKDGLVQEVTQAVVNGVQNKNTAANFEAEVLDSLKEKSSKATDERSDIEVMTLTDMEALKAIYRLIEVNSSLLKFQAMKNFSDFEVNSQDITQVKTDNES